MISCKFRQQVTQTIAKVIWVIMILKIGKCCLCKWKTKKVRILWRSFSKGTLIVLCDWRHCVYKFTQVKLHRWHQTPSLEPNWDKREQMKTHNAFLWGKKALPQNTSAHPSGRAAPTPFPKNHYSGSLSEGCRDQGISLTPKAGSFKERQLGSPKDRDVGAVWDSG